MRRHRRTPIRWADESIGLIADLAGGLRPRRPHEATALMDELVSAAHDVGGAVFRVMDPLTSAW